LKLTPAEAHYVVSRLIETGRLRAALVARTLADRSQEIRRLRERLASLEALGGLPGRGGGRGGPPAARRGRGKRRAAKLSPKVRALRRQQGRYMGFVRRLTAADKAKVKAVREKQGLAAAIRMAASIAGRSA
jgi:hypothetical protein